MAHDHKNMMRMTSLERVMGRVPYGAVSQSGLDEDLPLRTLEALKGRRGKTQEAWAIGGFDEGTFVVKRINNFGSFPHADSAMSTRDVYHLRKKQLREHHAFLRTLFKDLFLPLRTFVTHDPEQGYGLYKVQENIGREDVRFSDDSIMRLPSEQRLESLLQDPQYRELQDDFRTLFDGLKKLNDLGYILDISLENNLTLTWVQDPAGARTLRLRIFDSLPIIRLANHAEVTDSRVLAIDEMNVDPVRHREIKAFTVLLRRLYFQYLKKDDPKKDG